MPGHEIIGHEELAQITEIFENGSVLFRHGFAERRNGSFKVNQFESEFASAFGVDHALAVSSGTAALRVALASLGIGPGDEVITQAFTFVATVEAIVESGAKPVCADVDQTLNIDVSTLSQLINPNTKAIIAVHMLGVPCDLVYLTSFCKEHGLYLIEDTAWGLGATLNNKYLGTWGDVGTFSFDFAKLLTTGEGGMVVTSNPEIHEKSKAWHDHGHENNPNVPRWEDTRSSSGFNFRMTEMQGAVGIAQLNKLEFIITRQRENKMRIIEILNQYPDIILRSQPTGSIDSADAIIFFMKTSDGAKKFRENLFQAGISTKILPEAISWHFAGLWHHIPQLTSGWTDKSPPYRHTFELLSRSVSLPVFLEHEERYLDVLKSELDKFF